MSTLVLIVLVLVVGAVAGYFFLRANPDKAAKLDAAVAAATKK